MWVDACQEAINCEQVRLSLSSATTVIYSSLTLNIFIKVLQFHLYVFYIIVYNVRFVLNVSSVDSLSLNLNFYLLVTDFLCKLETSNCKCNLVMIYASNTSSNCKWNEVIFESWMIFNFSFNHINKISKREWSHWCLKLTWLGFNLILLTQNYLLHIAWLKFPKFWAKTDFKSVR